jgi:hypothetical protein
MRTRMLLSLWSYLSVLRGPAVFMDLHTEANVNLMLTHAPEFKKFLVITHSRECYSQQNWRFLNAEYFTFL